MPKTYREQPLPKIDDRYGLVVLKKRQRIVMRSLAEYVKRLDPDFIIEAATEVGLDECITYAKRGGALTFDLTPLQAVSLTAALAALVEVRDSARV